MKLLNNMCTWQAAASAVAVAQASKQPSEQEEGQEDRDLPQFGTGIEFRPKGELRHA